jgi:hypothetical protein
MRCIFDGWGERQFDRSPEAQFGLAMHDRVLTEGTIFHAYVFDVLGFAQALEFLDGDSHDGTMFGPRKVGGLLTR